MRENQYEKKVQEIFSRYCRPPQMSTNQLLRQKVLSFAEAQKGAPWVLFGAGRLTRELLEEVDLSGMSGMQGILDNNESLWDSDFLGTKIVNPSRIKELGVQSVLLCMLHGYEDRKAELLALHPSLQVVDVLEEIRNDGGYATGVCLSYQDTYHMLQQEKCSMIAYTDLYFFKRRYETTTDEKEKKTLLSNQIDTYIWMRDFVNGFHLMDLYVANYGGGHYDLLKQELEDLLQDLKETLQDRTHKDMLLVLLDSLPAVQFYGNKEFSYLQSLAKEGTSYTKAYSPGIFTSESLSSMWRKVPVMQLAEEGGTMDTPFSKVLQAQGYSSGVAYSRDIKKIPPKGVEPQQFYEEGVLFQETSMEETLPQQYWCALTSMATAAKPHFFMIHSINETHEPFYCGRFQQKDVIAKNNVDYTRGQLQDSLNRRFSDVFTYVDEQSAFYLSMLGTQTKKVFFADHGNHYETILSLDDPEKTPRRYSDSFHVPFFIHGGGVPQQEISTLFSTLYLSDVLEGLLDGVTTVPPQEMVEIALLPFRSETLIAQWVDHGFEYEISGLHIVLDEEYKMVQNGNGDCLYYAMKEEGTEIQDPTLVAVIQTKLGHGFHKDHCLDLLRKETHDDRKSV